MLMVNKWWLLFTLNNYLSEKIDFLFIDTVQFAEINKMQLYTYIQQKLITINDEG